MFIELYEGDRRQARISVRGELMTIPGREYTRNAATNIPSVFTLRTEEREAIDTLANAAYAVLAATANPDDVVQRRPATDQRGPRLRLVIEVAGVRREVEWSYPDQPTPAVAVLTDTLRAEVSSRPRRDFQERVVEMCREKAAAKLGVAPETLELVDRTAEGFDVDLNIPGATRSGGIPAVALAGFRVTLRSGTTNLAYHATSHERVVFAETWPQGAFPQYAPAVLDMAHYARRRGRLDSARTALQTIIGRGDSGSATQAELELAEVYALQGQAPRARQLFTRHIGSGSQEAHVLATCGLAWLNTLRVASAEPPAPPPSQWAELSLHPWWRPVPGRVAGVPARYPALAQALADAPASHRAAFTARHPAADGLTG